MAIQTVGIVGAGVSGLTAVKSCVEEGLKPICFERASGVGGVWYTDDDKTRKEFNFTFDTLTTNTSKEMQAMSDFPFPEDYPPFPTPRHMQDYFASYAKHFGLMKHIRLNQSVTKITKIESGRWKIVSKDVDKGDVTETEVDALIVSTGLQGSPYVPDIPGSKDFKGELIHSQEFRRGTDYIGKNVLVLGSAFSAGDISVDCSRHCKQTYVSSRRGFWVLRRTFKGKGPWDTHVLSWWFNYLPELLQELYLEIALRQLINHGDLGIESDIRLYSGASIMINDSINDQIMCGKLKVVKEVKSFTKDGAVFLDGSTVEDIDAIILATGYNKYYPYLDEKMQKILIDEFGLYKYIFIPGEPTFAAIGLAKGLGPQGPSYELQSRYVARIFNGKCKLPSIDEMNKDIKDVTEANINDHGSRHSYVLWIPYVQDLAREIGCLPSAWDYIFSSPRMAMKIALGTIYPFVFRLTGPSKWDGAMNAILDSPRKMVKGTKTRVTKVQYKNVLDTLSQVLLVGLLVVAAVLVKCCLF